MIAPWMDKMQTEIFPVKAYYEITVTVQSSANNANFPNNDKYLF
jgi:hypothetical protein